MASFLDGALAEAFRLATDGSAVDPVAFQEALRADPAKLAAIEADEELRDVVLGQDTTALQALLRTIFQVSMQQESTQNASIQMLYITADTFHDKLETATVVVVLTWQ